MSVMMFFILTLTFIVPLFGQIDEFPVYGPMDIHSKAMDLYMRMRKEFPEDSLDYDGPFLTKAKLAAISRQSMKSEDDLGLWSAVITGSSTESPSDSLNLPLPDSKDFYLSSAINNQIIHNEEVNRALATAFNEEVGLGAISRAGALPSGSDGKWLKLVEDKLKKDNALDYQSLLWEMGTELEESHYVKNGGLNITHENGLLQRMTDWFLRKGGSLNYVEPSFFNSGFKLLVKEDVDHLESVVLVPMELIMCQQTARNVVIYKRGRYLGEELQKTFEKNEVWGLSIFLLHEYYKEINGKGSKWGPFIRTLRMRVLSSDIMRELKGTLAAELLKEWIKSSDSLMWWSSGADGPCSPTTGICRTKPLEKSGDSRFSIHQIRWAYWIVKQNAVRVRHAATGYEFIALVPFYNMMMKRSNIGGGVSFEQDGMVRVRIGGNYHQGDIIGIQPGNFSDSEFYTRYLDLPSELLNDHTKFKLNLPGTLPKGSKFHTCLKGSEKEKNSDECRGSFKSESMFWKSKELTKWRNNMNLPPRLQELRMWATRLHLYGGQEEMKLLNIANHAVAGLPIPLDQMPAEEQLMLLGLAKDTQEAALIVQGRESAMVPQLYSAPDPAEDMDALRAMEHLAMFAAQAHRVISTGNSILNATKAVLNHTRNFFLHGILPSAGLDELDEFLLKKIGMLTHCGFENDMVISYHNISDELLCAVRVHLMNDSEMHIFCPSEVKVWQENCMDVEFLNYTAISYHNEYLVIESLRKSIHALLNSYSSSVYDDMKIVDSSSGYGLTKLNAVKLRLREKLLLNSALEFLEVHENKLRDGSLQFQLDLKVLEREESTRRQLHFERFLSDVRKAAEKSVTVASINVKIDNFTTLSLAIEEGDDLHEKVVQFCSDNNIPATNVNNIEKALRANVTKTDSLLLLLGVIVPAGERKVLGIADGLNVTFQTFVFCAKYNMSRDCGLVDRRVHERLHVTFDREILLHVPIDSPDGRKLSLIVREGEQHDVLQHVADFFEYHHLPGQSIELVTREIRKRLPAVALTVPINIAGRRLISCSFFHGGNITNTVEGFINFYELDRDVHIALLKRGRYGMNPGTFSPVEKVFTN